MFEITYEMEIVAIEKIGSTNRIQIVAQNEYQFDGTTVSVTWSAPKTKLLSVGDKVKVYILKEDNESSNV